MAEQIRRATSRPPPTVSRPTPSNLAVGPLLAVTALATTCGVLPGFLIGAQAVQLGRDLRLDAVSVGAAVAATWFTASASSSLMGRVSERLGGARGLQAGALVSAASMLAVALFARSWIVLAGFAAVGGMANALAQPSANVLIAESLPPERHGLGFGVKQSAIPFATLLGGFAVPTIALTVGWRWTFVAGALLALAAAAALSRLVLGNSQRPTSTASPSTGVEADGGEREVEKADVEIVRPTTTGANPRWLLAVMGSAVAFGAAAAGALAAFLVVGAVEVGISEASAGLLLGGGSVIVVVSRLSLGVRADRVGGDQLVVVSVLMAIGSVAVATFALGARWSYLVAAPVAFGAGWAWPGLFNLSVVRRFPLSPGAATGTTQTGTYLGAGLGPIIFGFVVERHGFSAAWLVAGSWLVVAATIIWLARRSAPLHVA